MCFDERELHGFMTLITRGSDSAGMHRVIHANTVAVYEHTHTHKLSVMLFKFTLSHDSHFLFGLLRLKLQTIHSQISTVYRV